MKQILIGIFTFFIISQTDAQTMEATQEEIMQSLSKAKMYTFVLLVNGPNYEQAEKADKAAMEKVQMEHLKYFFNLKKQGKVPIFGPFTDGAKIHGIFIFNSDNKEDVKKMMDQDPQVKAGYTSYEMYSYFGLPGDNLPGN
jgi:uncharacterized protein YciI